MGIVNIDDDLHDQIRKASVVSCRSINAQAAFWIKVGMLCEMNPTQSFKEIITRQLRAAGVVAPAVKVADMTKRPEEIELLAQSGKLLADVFGYLDGLSLIGMSTMQVNDLVDSFIVNELNARPASKGQYGYVYALNSSPNNVVCHGVPSEVLPVLVPSGVRVRG